ncbi:MAG: NADH-quinone oxidoreductase subunit H [Candidatus Omnitrophica bacterium]|nr:NADH-quinone oxidoreductase subunit H [Candidatus Omnitrophota bacterium]
MIRTLFTYIVFPGFLFSAVVGLLAGWIDRKVTARIHWRVGPPWHQNFTDILKLLGKETIVPPGRKVTFLGAPYIGLLGAVCVAGMVGRVLFTGQDGFAGDLIVILYLLTLPAISLIIGASASRNPLASIGGSREIKLVLAYELPFIISVVAISLKTQGTLQLSHLLGFQGEAGSHIASISGILAFCVALLCMQAKLGFVPFDASEAEQEIMGGVLIEYSGLPLAIFKLTKAILLATLPLLLTVLFLGKDTSPLFVVLKFVGIITLFVLIKNTNPRVRIDQSIRFFWGPMTVVALAALGLAIVGL